jgi:hypothetical protein
MDTESTTIQDDLIKKILEFPYETLGIQKGGIYGDETFDKNGYLSDSNINSLRERLIKYKIVGFEFGNFGDYRHRYDKDIELAHYAVYFSDKNFDILEGTHVYAVFVDETGNCYGNFQITAIVPLTGREGFSIPWAEELFINPFIKRIEKESAIENLDNIECYYGRTKNNYYRMNLIKLCIFHWTKYRPWDAIDRKVKPKQNIDTKRIFSIIDDKKVFELSMKHKRSESEGVPILYYHSIYSFKNIILSQVEEYETEKTKSK